MAELYWQRPDVREFINQHVRDLVWQEINPEYNEADLKRRINEEFKNDFIDFCDGEHYPQFTEVVDVFFSIINAETITDLQGLKRILRHTLNCLYRAQGREEDYRTWYAELVSRFEAFLKKIYWMKNGEPIPLTNAGREPAFLDTVRHFPHINSLYTTRNEKFVLFKQFYNVVYSWRNNENHRALDMSSELLPTALHAAVALYLYAAMVSADELEN